MSHEADSPSMNFLEAIIDEDLKKGTLTDGVVTRFPPEPNGYLHIGHAKSICLNFGLGQTFGGRTHLRFDDTNPATEDTEYVEAIQQDIKWLGFDWGDHLHFASDYFEQLYDYACDLIKAGKAYVDDSTLEEIRSMRGVPTSPGQESPFRSRSAEENLDLFQRMRNGEFEEGSKVLRAKIDMSSPNMHMRDPIMYRILKKHHHRTGDKWSIYPMYDWAHGQSDAIEGISHSICTLEFEVHRPLYEWFLDQLPTFPQRPRQYEFARLNLSYTVTSKRKLNELVTSGIVNGWDDPRMPTIAGMRRRGYTAKAIRNFSERVGVARRENVIDLSLLEFSVREDLNKTTHRVMAVLDPLKVTITNYPEGQTEDLMLENTPEDPEAGSRAVPFSRNILIEHGDFMENPPRKFFRLGVGREVRLKGAYIIKCEDVVKNEAGEIVELLCTYDPNSKSGADTSGKKVKGTLHWVSEDHAIKAEVRQYDRLFKDEDPAGHKEQDFKEFLNENSLTVLEHAYLEPSLKEAKPGERFQFMRKGYYCVDLDSTPEKQIFNLTVTLKDSWAKMQKK
ncbi:glutamine--tRNA ligase/YqeY domain fusion protein [Pontibacter sp. G13]|uniref:glutamine--tRNA ligase/YqeY domain fusion protein n=1 Tax=Pontibacter sp. G13 TaxID=3074898 RepID=UPI0028895E3D|nr:glutamine--tRNA ligase/YqeY domain fusion protein [Pontibacter sp. G13]WNJ20661.1 glutamine--tRNA ligase/YqeY domain fusion protein [Pontibacter sp. G13]